MGIRQIQRNYNYKEERDKWCNAVVIDLDCRWESPGELEKHQRFLPGGPDLIGRGRSQGTRISEKLSR